MPYVMVPVPEEHVVEVMEFVIRTVARAAFGEWDAESMEKLFLESDEVNRSLLSVVARHVSSGKNLTDQAAADSLQLSGREMHGAIREINEAAKDSNRPLLLYIETVDEALPNGRVRSQNLVLMRDNYARLVREAERAELTSNPPISPGTE
jgi:hypothetical protein